MKKLICKILGHWNYTQYGNKYYMTKNCRRCNMPMYNDRREKIIKAVELFQSKFGKDWLKHIRV